MPIGVYSDFKIYDPQFQGGQYEVTAQNLQVFNAASGNALRVVSQELVGHYNKEAFFKKIADVIAHRTLSGVGAVSDKPMTQDELVGVKVNKRIGPLAQTLDAVRKIGMTDEEISYILGQIIGSARLENMVNTAVLAVEAALENVSALNCDWTAEKDSGDPSTLCHKALIKGLSKFGDQSQRIIAWVMHSKPYFDLLGQTLVDKIVNVANVTIYQGTVATLGRPSIVVDAPALHDDNGSLTDTYNVLGLVPDACVVVESEEGGLVSEVVTGLENLVVRFQGEYAYNVNIKGMAYNTSSGINPNDTTLGTKTNWVQKAASVKDLAGVRIKVE